MMDEIALEARLQNIERTQLEIMQRIENVTQHTTQIAEYVPQTAARFRHMTLEIESIRQRVKPANEHQRAELKAMINEEVGGARTRLHGVEKQVSSLRDQMSGVIAQIYGASREQRAVDLREQGHTFAEIGRRIGSHNDTTAPVSSTRAQQLYRRGLRERET